MLCKFSLIMPLVAALAYPCPVFAQGGAPVIAQGGEQHKVYTTVHIAKIGGKRLRTEIGTSRPVQCTYTGGGSGAEGCEIITCTYTGTPYLHVNTCLY